MWPLIKAVNKGKVKTNYRPVSNLPFISKIIEKCTLIQLTTHCNIHNFLLEYQSAYRKFYSCETSLLKLVSDTLWAIEKQQITAVLVMDLSAAFNTVDHNLLLNVLQEKIGITNTVLKWYNNFLKPRKIKVCINGSYSSEQVMDFSLPHGSTQGTY